MASRESPGYAVPLFPPVLNGCDGTHLCRQSHFLYLFLKDFNLFIRQRKGERERTSRMSDRGRERSGESSPRGPQNPDQDLS